MYPNDDPFNRFMGSPGLAMAGQGLQNIMALRRDQVPRVSPIMAAQEAMRQNQMLNMRRAQILDQKRYRDAQMAQRAEELARSGGSGAASSKAFAPKFGKVGGESMMLTPTYDPATNSTQLVPTPLPEGWVEDSGIEKVDRGDRIDLYRKSDGALIGTTTKELAPEKQPGYIQEASVAGATGKAGVERASQYFDQIRSVDKYISNIGDAIAAVEGGAGTGFVESAFPSIRAASVELDNIRNNMGLDIVGQGSFGALSESELAFALDTAMPSDLDGPDLLDWLNRKQTAQQKLRRELTDAAMFFSEGGSVGDYMKMQQEDLGSTDGY